MKVENDESYKDSSSDSSEKISSDSEVECMEIEEVSKPQKRVKKEILKKAKN